MTRMHGLVLVASIGIFWSPALAEAPAKATATGKEVNAVPFAGIWTADMKTVPPQKPPLKSQTLTVTQMAGGYIAETRFVHSGAGGGGTGYQKDRIELGGKPFNVGGGEIHTCNQAAPNTIHCVISMGGQSIEQIYALSDGGNTLTDTMKANGPDGKLQSMSSVYHRRGAAPTAIAGPQRIATDNGECEIVVPATWTADPTESMASSSDDVVVARLSTAAYVENLKTLADFKKLYAGTYKQTKMFEDTQSRLWYQYAPHYKNNDGWFVAVLGKTGICDLQISFKNSVIPDEAVAKNVVNSLKPVP